MISLINPAMSCERGCLPNCPNIEVAKIIEGGNFLTIAPAREAIRHLPLEFTIEAEDTITYKCTLARYPFTPGGGILQNR